MIFTVNTKRLKMKKDSSFERNKQEERNGKWDQYEDMHCFKWPEKEMKTSFKIEKLL